MKKKLGITRFPGTNCDRDIEQFGRDLGLQTEYIWHEDSFDKKKYDFIIIPGGFSYGDYLRCGAMAAQSQVMKSVREFADSGGPVMGICNGFQILCETGLLPGVLLRNSGLRYIDRWVELVVQNPGSVFTKSLKSKQKISLPIAHGEGRYYTDEGGLKKLQDHGQIWLTYLENPNGSLCDIAGISNKQKNVYGLMPHPERAMFDWMGGIDGREFL